MHHGVNWGVILERNAKKYRNKIALIFEDRKFTYGELFELINMTANFLIGRGVEKGHRVCLYLPNCWEYFVCHFGVLRAGAAIVPFNVMYKSRELNYMINDSGAETIITTSELYPNVAAIKETTKLRNVILIDANEEDELSLEAIYREPRELIKNIPLNEREDLSLLQYTSGTTGEPKGAMLTYHNILSTIRTLVSVNATHDSDTTLSVLPMFHSFGIFTIYSSVFSGGTVVLVRRFDAELVLTLIDRYNVTLFNGVPTMLISFINTPNLGRFKMKSLRYCVFGGAIVPLEVLDKFKILTNVTAVDGYGLTEAYGVIMTPYEGVYRHGSIGIPMPHVEVRVVDDNDKEVAVGEVGEIVIQGPNVMKGYWNKPAETEEAKRGGWFHTGDLGRKDEDGYYYIAGRKKDMIIASGFNIYPKEIEEVLYKHEKVADAAVIGIKHGYKGETVKACVVLKTGEDATPEEIIAYCRSTLASFKVPTVVEFMDELPRNAAGKVLKRVLQEEAAKNERS